MRSRLSRLPTLALLAIMTAGALTPTIAAARTSVAPEGRDVHARKPAVKPTTGGEDAAEHAEETDGTDPQDAPAGPIDRRTLSIGRGDTLMDLLAQAKVPANDAHDAVAALRDVYNPRRLQAGQQVTVLFEPRRSGTRKFVGLEFAPDPLRSVSIARKGASGFTSTQVEKTVTRKPVAAQGVIRSSLFEAAAEAGVPVGVMMSFIQDFSYDVDFQRDLQPGDRFEILYEKLVTSDGVAAGDGDVLYASLTLSGEDMPIYRYKTRDGRVDYYNGDGESIRRALLRTPVDGARITSGFGMRRHPILGFSKMHQGVDFGAPAGTPIYAAGRGVVELAQRSSSYGNYVRIRHNTEITTAYAHMSRFAKSISRGGRVEQGDIIGYVGSTGRATGPHLHYEVLKGGRQVNPRSIDLPTGEKLDGRELQAFQQARRSLERLFEESRGGLQLARTPAEDKTCNKATSC
ncbi:M23 family metallopeptidase [Azospirillum picis]|uniref:Murein DD-endopeptidase MepM/ murein hydrolase activator NlpD n=1 Tax=Azospirillum picis TaxID=488438 RepID=A0ABU0MKY5_9PROT|nr:M23 family metallopeptidase [Azospirillum picis]MBP2300281.1 murein DD-endopeptidase MepM/ murein hydrolase activator NlpD [Azospirillum picis]MDQ0534077.1 murein DD-endopeptidase MepM/ murein hydrolase activator NlpD [Azospirillum picis]